MQDHTVQDKQMQDHTVPDPAVPDHAVSDHERLCMTTPELTPQESARWALRAGLPLADDRLAPVTDTANHIQSVLGVLRELDFQQTPPAPVYQAGGSAGAAV